MSATREQALAFTGSLQFRDQTDFIIKIGIYEWHVHSDLISKQSKFFEKVCSGPFKESRDRIVTLHDDCPRVVGRMLQFFYFRCYEITDAGSYRLNWAPGVHHDMPSPICLDAMMLMGDGQQSHADIKDVDNQRTESMIHATMYQVADKYEIEELRAMASEKLTESPGLNMEDFLMMLDIIGTQAACRDRKLLRDILATLIPKYLESSDDDIRFKALLGHEAELTIAVIEEIRKVFAKREKQWIHDETMKNSLTLEMRSKNEIIEEKTKRSAMFLSELSARDQTNIDLRRDKTALKQQFNAGKIEIDLAKRATVDAQFQVAAKDRIIEKSSKENARLQGLLANSRKDIQDHEARQNIFRKVVAARDKRINEVYGESTILQQKLRDKDQEIADQQTRIRQLEKQLATPQIWTPEPQFYFDPFNPWVTKKPWKL